MNLRITYSKIVKHKANSQLLSYILAINNWNLKIKIQPFYINTIQMKYMGINLRKYI